MSERTPIKPEDIREGDLIRWERETDPGNANAIEFTASRNGIPWSHDEGTHYLLDRPEPPFEPYWGMVIAKSPHSVHRAIYSPGYEHDSTPWASTSYESERDEDWDWRSNEWAKQKLSEGWKILEKPAWAP